MFVSAIRKTGDIFPFQRYHKIRELTVFGDKRRISILTPLVSAKNRAWRSVLPLPRKSLPCSAKHYSPNEINRSAPQPSQAGLIRLMTTPVCFTAKAAKFERPCTGALDQILVFVPTFCSHDFFQYTGAERRRRRKLCLAAHEMVTASGASAITG